MIDRLFDILRLHDFGLLAAAEVAVLSVLIYLLLLQIKGTRAVQMMYGVLGLLFVSWVTSPQLLGFTTIHRILIELLVYVPFAIIVVFQNTIRRTLTGLGANPLGRVLGGVGSAESNLEPILSAAFHLAQRRIGALIVIEREQGLRNWSDSGIALDAHISYDLIVNIFSPYTPLHDGALIVADGRLRAASCYLPLTSSAALSTQFGTRHRAAIGISEETDAVAIVISEERAVVSIAQDGVLREAPTPDAARRLIGEALEPIARRRPVASGSRSEVHESAPQPPA